MNTAIASLPSLPSLVSVNSSVAASMPDVGNSDTSATPVALTTSPTRLYNDFITANSLELFKAIVVEIKTKSRKEGLTSMEHLFYNLIRGLKPTRGFSNLKEEKTQGFVNASRELRYQLKFGKGYDPRLSPESVAQLVQALEA